MDFTRIKGEIDRFEKKHPLDELQPIKKKLLQGHEKGMKLTQLVKLIRKDTTLKPTTSSLREWLGLPKPAPRKKKEPAPNSSALNQNGSS